MSISTYESRKYQCTICMKRFIATNHLREHMTLHSDKTNYKCEKCQMEFKSPGSWRNHMRKEHGFECPQCGKNFSTLTLLKQHRMSKHREIMRQKLEDEVGMIDKSELSLNSNGFKATHGHQRTVKFPQIKTAATIVSAPKSIVKKIIEKSRQNSNSGNTKIGKYVCKMCGFRYELSRSLARHMETAHKESSKYCCTRCDYTTNRSDNFKIHSERHANGNSIKCKFSSCSCLFFSVKNLKIHMKRKHSNETKITVKKEFKEAELDENERELLDELDPDDNDDENGELEENVDFKFHNNSFLNSTEKSTKLNNSGTKKTTQLKISTCFSINSKQEESKKEEKKEKAKPKSSGCSAVTYECCECKIDFPGNTELWDHLLAVHIHKMKNNGKK